MNSGLYAFAGASATATAAAWVNRLLEPMTNVSKVYLGLSRASRGSTGRVDPEPLRPGLDRRPFRSEPAKPLARESRSFIGAAAQAVPPNGRGPASPASPR